ncbi:MAG TPA: biotin--[acetyl-CoA-carboxylase] ligase [Bacteroidia bacterium]
MDTLFIGNNIVRLTEVDSTNSYARALLKDVNVHEGMVIWADNQTNGRGQRGSVWNAEPLANITFSLILNPGFLNATNHFHLSKIVALAIHATLTEILGTDNYDIKIKWPNDILVNRKKICGVLIEHIFRADHIHQSIVGIGLNVNQVDFGELESKATSLKLVSGKEFARDEVLSKLLKNLEVLYLQLKQGKEKEININYLKFLLYFEQETSFNDLKNNSSFKGKIVNVLPNGYLEVEFNSGERRKFDMKEVGFGY